MELFTARPGFSGIKTIEPAEFVDLLKEEAVKLLAEGNELIVQNSNGDYLLKVSGISITDHFQIVNEFNIPNERIYMMAVPYIGGYNPDYSGLDFCDQASRCIVQKVGEVLNAAHPPLHAEC